MACFLVPTTEAVITTTVQKVLEHKEKKTGVKSDFDIVSKMGSLNKMLWGGSALLAFEHVWHGEVTPFFPFLTAMNDPESTATMLHEMGTSGVAMALLVTAVWAVKTVFEVMREKKFKAENSAGGIK